MITSKNYHYIPNNNSNNSLFNLKNNNYQTNINSNFTSKNNINVQPLPNKNINMYSTKNNFFNYQDRVINFGQDSNEAMFKKTLRKPIILTNSINIITGAQMNNYNYNKTNLPSKFQSSSNTSLEKVEDIFLKMGANSTSRQPFNPIRTPVSNFNSQRNVIHKNILDNKENTNEAGKVITPRKELLNGNNINYNENRFGTTFTNNFNNKDNNLYKTSYNSSFNNYNSNTNLVNDNNYNSHFNTNKVTSPLYNNSRSNTPTSGNFYIKQGISVKEYAYQEEQNSNFREYMEDRQKCVDNFMKDKNNSFFAIFDGHGGSKVADYAKDKFPEILEKLIKNSPQTNLENILTTSFQKIDDEIKLQDCEHIGCTATVVHISLEKNKKVLYCANVGDSRCVLVSSTNAKRLSYDHKATDFSEIERVRKSGGIIFNGRVLGQLMLTRALGDFSLKKQGVICTPSIQKHYISDKDKYLVLASDGIWDMINDDEIFKFSLKAENAEELTKVIVKNAMFRGSMDNIGCLVIKLN